MARSTVRYTYEYNEALDAANRVDIKSTCWVDLQAGVDGTEWPWMSGWMGGWEGREVRV